MNSCGMRERPSRCTDPRLAQHRVPADVFGSANVYAAGGEYFGEAQTYVSPRSGDVYLAYGKVTMMGFKVRGWTKDGVSTTPIASFVGGAQVTLEACNVALAPPIASQLRGFQPADGNLTVVKVPAGRKPALDGSLVGWESADSAHFLDDGLNVDGPGVIDARLMYDPDTLYIHWTVNLNQVREPTVPIVLYCVVLTSFEWELTPCLQHQTGWKYPLVGLEPANRMFVHGRAACTCSLYIQGNCSAGPAFKGVNPLGRNGDVRFVRRLPWIAYQDCHMLS